MDNILKVLTKISESESLTKELAEKETIEEVYAYCTSISGGYTIDEFKSFVRDLFKDKYKMSEDNLEKVVGGGFSDKKLYLSLLSTVIAFSPLINVKGLSDPECEPKKELTSVTQKQNNLFEKDSKKGFSELKKFAFGSTVVTAGALILYAFKDSMFLNISGDALNLLREFRGIDDSLKWKLVIDGKCHDDNNPNIFDEHRDDHPGEPGYRESMIRALNYTLSNGCMNRPFNADLYLDLHRMACTNVNFGNDQHDRINYRFQDTSTFGINGGHNYSFDGEDEFKQKFGSSWRSDKLFAYDQDRKDLAFGKLNKGHLGPGVLDYLNEYCAPYAEEQEDMIQAVNIIFEDYYSKLQELDGNGHVAGSLIAENASLEDKKLEIIIRICQNLDQLHAFRDGNVRTIVFLVMQRMLIENGLTPTSFYEPNCIDMKSVSEIMVELKDGQNRYRQIVAESNGLRNNA